MSFDEFADRLKAYNSWPLVIGNTGINSFTTADGSEIKFEITPKKGMGSIASIDNNVFERKMSLWPRAQLIWVVLSI